MKAMSGDRSMRVALISSGAGHVSRGIEIWMLELARHLSSACRAELWAGREPVGGPRPAVWLGNVGRDSPGLRSLPWERRYQAEQLTALPKALWALRRRRMTVAYCGDPYLAWNLKRFRRWHGAKVVFMNGMRLTPRWLRDYDGIHLLAPPYLSEAQAMLPPEKAGRFFAVPHFADTERFVPPTPWERRSAREELGLPAEAFIVLTVGPVGSVSGKRLDHLAEEVAAASSTALLVSAGAPEDGAEAVRARARRALGDRFRELGRVERDPIGRLYQAADVYSLGSLAEPFSIAILEALASGLPVVHNEEETMVWQTGAGGVAVPMKTPGAAVPAFRKLESDPVLRARIALAARALAEARYAPGPVCAALEQELRRVSERPAPARR